MSKPIPTNTGVGEKVLYWVQFIDQSNGMKIDDYFLARDLQHLESEISDITQIKVIQNVHDLTEESA